MLLVAGGAVSDSTSNSGHRQSSADDKDHPVSVSSEEEEAASFPTQALEPSTEKTVVAVTLPKGEEEPTGEEASSSGLQDHEAGHAERGNAD